MKKIIKCIFTIVLSVLFIIKLDAASNNTTLKDLKDKLAKEAAEVTAIENKQNRTKNSIKAIEKDLDKIAKEIDDYELSIK